jgi:hypothetical protein
MLLKLSELFLLEKGDVATGDFLEFLELFCYREMMWDKVMCNFKSDY